MQQGDLYKHIKDIKGFIADSIYRSGFCNSLQSYFRYFNRFAYDEEINPFYLVSHVKSQKHLTYILEVLSAQDQSLLASFLPAWCPV